MPYDPNQIMGLDALSPTIAAYKQFVERQNNVGDPNVVQFLASRGEPQLAGLIAKKMRVENAAKAQQALAQQPQSAPPTVADQYNMAEQQQSQQAMAAQMAQMQQAQMAQAAPGLAGMPNPAMDRASFAGGGIVAFADGGDVQHYAIGGLTPEEETEFKALQNQEQQYNQLVGRGGIASVAGSPMERDVGAARNRMQQLQSKIDAYVDQVGRLAGQGGMASVEAYTRAHPELSARSSTPTIPAATTGTGFGNLRLAEAPPREVKKPTDESSTKKPPTTTTQRAPAAPAAATEDATLRNLIGAEPTLQKTTLKTEGLDEEKAFIKAHKEAYGSDSEEARRAFFIQTGLDILGSSDPNVIRAIGTAAGKNYTAMQADLRALKKEKDALDLQGIKLKQAYEQAQRTQDKDDAERYDRLHSNWMAGSLELEKMKQTARENALNRQSAEYRTRLTADAASGKSTLDEKRRIYTGAISAADKVLTKYKDMPDAALTPQQKLERDAALKQRTDANNALLKLGGLGSTGGTSGNIGDMSNEELMQAIAGGD